VTEVSATFCFHMFYIASLTLKGTILA